MKLFKKWEEHANYYMPLIVIILIGGMLFLEDEKKPYPLFLKILIYFSILLFPVVLSPPFYDYFKEKKGSSAVKEIIQYLAITIFYASFVWWSVVFFW